MSAPTCPNCGGAFDDEGLCGFCHQGVRFAGEGFRGSDSELDCPVCTDRRLYEITFRGVRIDVCTHCSGAWFDLGEVEQIVNNTRVEAQTGAFEATPADVPAPPPRERAYIGCPKCGAMMNVRNWERRSGILVDGCRHHGVWLDGGEVARIRSWAASTPDGPPTPPQEPTAKPRPKTEKNFLVRDYQHTGQAGWAASSGLGDFFRKLFG